MLWLPKWENGGSARDSTGILRLLPAVFIGLRNGHFADLTGVSGNITPLILPPVAQRSHEIDVSLLALLLGFVRSSGLQFFREAEGSTVKKKRH